MALDLRIPVDEIPAAGLRLAGSLPKEWLAPSLLPAYTCLEPLEIDIEVTRYNDNVHVKGQLSTSLGFECSRSLKSGTIEFKVSFDELFQPAGADTMNLNSGIEAVEFEADEPYTYTGHLIDLEPLVREEFVPGQNPYPTQVPAAATQKPVWTSDTNTVDPRWAKLKDLKLN